MSPRRGQPHWWNSYGVAVLSGGIALLLTELLDGPYSELNTPLFFVAAVAVSAWYGGLGPGLLAMVLNALADMWFFLSPIHSLVINSQRTAIRLLEFLLCSCLLVWLNVARRSALQKAEAARAEADLLRAEAEEATRLKDTFLAQVSHELRTPMTSIMGWVHLLRGGRLNQEMTVRALETVERNSRIQTRLIDDLLDISRIVAGRLHLELHEVMPAELIRAVVEMLRPEAEVKVIRILLTLDETVGPVTGDPERLQQVIWNLLANAIHYTPTKGQIEVGLSQNEACVQMFVRDTGQGIAPELLPFIFDSFRQADVTLRREGGLGLGLTIARQIVELHSGTIRAASAGRNQGATFTLCLPLAHPQN